MKALVACYSRSGNTEALGEAISKALGADFDEIIDLRDRAGFIGYMRAALSSILGKLTEIKYSKNPADYDIVIVGTPVWVGVETAAVRTYLSQNKGKIKRVAFFATSGGGGADKAIKSMEELCGKKPAATIQVNSKDLRGFDISDFVKKISQKRD